MAQLDIISQAYESRALNIDARKLINWYTEAQKPLSNNVKALINCPGLDLVTTINALGECRGLYTTSTGRMFGVTATELWELSTSEVKTTRGTLTTANTAIVYADNGTQMMFVDGTYGYIYDLGANTLTTISDPDFPSNPTHVLFTDGYFVVNEGGTGKFYWSSSYDGTSWDSTEFAQAEYSADNLQAITKTSNGTLWMIGKQSYELWQGVADPDLPWRRIGGTVKEVGTVAKYSVATNGDQVFWLGSSAKGYGSIFMGSGYESKRISTPAIEYRIKQLTDIDNAEAYVYQDETHSFYVISFESEKTYVYDVSTGLWHERASLNTVSGVNQRHRSRGYTFFNMKHYVGDYVHGKLYHLDLDTYDEDGDPIEREIVTPHVIDKQLYKLLRYRYFELDFERGIGLVGGAEPQIMMQYSDDGGHTYTSEAWTGAAVGAGSIGEYEVRARWDRLGAAHDRVWRITCSDPVKWIITRCFIEVE